MKKNVRRVLAALLGVMMILTLSMTAIMAEEAAEENPKVSIPVTIRLTGDYPRNERYTIVLKADDAAYPMPEGSVNGRYEMTITGAGTESFPEIVYNRVGVYTYQVWQKPGSDPDGDYDDTIYYVTVYITNDEQNGGLNITVVAYADGNTEEKTEIIFKNYYEYDIIPPPPETKPETKPAETKPPETKPVETKPVETKPVETEPVETEPEETEPEETEPEETEPETETETETEPEETEEILEQTGQLNWPISVLSVGGMGCLALGCVFLTGDRKKEEEDEDVSEEEIEEEFEEGLEDVVEEDDKEETDGE
ncbi:MAG: hypothetical protein J6D10_06680 [Clostridia bacterium]|nr:hypothetical protein [Clostridia bacterium]